MSGAKTNTDEKMRLELQGEKAANGMRALLLLIFIASFFAAYKGGVIEGVEPFYYVGMAAFATPLIVSLIALRLGKYDPWMKYWGSALEILSYFLTNMGYLYLATPVQWIGAVNSPTRILVWFLLIGMTALRFSPRVSLFSGFLTAGAYTTLNVLLLVRPEISLAAKGTVAADSAAISLVQVVLCPVFMAVMGIVLSISATFIRGLLDTARRSEGDARTNLDHITNLVAEGARIGEDLNQAVTNIRSVTLANEELSRDQLASIEETSAAMEQMSASIQAIAQKAKVQDELCDKNARSMNDLGDLTNRIESLTKQANNQGEQTLERTLLGEKALENALEGIQRIQEGSIQVAEIVTVINGIADKTNLLALNAAIEAARAGAEGRGFSVVADEVGKLADLSSNNSRIIEELISETRNDTELGVQSIEETVKSLKGVTAGIKSIVESVAEVYNLVARQSTSAGEVVQETQKIQTIALDMKNATSEQMEGTREIMNAVNSINSVADKFARNYSQLMDAAEVLSRTNSRMNEQIGRFDGDSGPPR